MTRCRGWDAGRILPHVSVPLWGLVLYFQMSLWGGDMVCWYLQVIFLQNFYRFLQNPRDKKGSFPNSRRKCLGKDTEGPSLGLRCVSLNELLRSGSWVSLIGSSGITWPPSCPGTQETIMISPHLICGVRVRVAHFPKGQGRLLTTGGVGGDCQ